MLGHGYHSIGMHLRSMFIPIFALGTACGMRYTRFCHTHISCGTKMKNGLGERVMSRSSIHVRVFNNWADHLII